MARGAGELRVRGGRCDGEVGGVGRYEGEGESFFVRVGRRSSLSGHGGYRNGAEGSGTLKRGLMSN